jgi:hypothetical protein
VDRRSIKGCPEKLSDGVDNDEYYKGKSWERRKRQRKNPGAGYAARQRI